MRKIQFALLALVAVFTLSCSSDDSAPADVPNDATYINFKVNGVQSNIAEPFTLTSLMASVTGTEDLGADIRSIILTVPVTPTVGTHAITDADPADLTAYSAHYSLGDASFDATSGTMNITSIGEEYMEGTFSFTGEYDGTTYTISEGVFRAYKPTND